MPCLAKDDTPSEQHKQVTDIILGSVRAAGGLGVAACKVFATPGSMSACVADGLCSCHTCKYQSKKDLWADEYAGLHETAQRPKLHSDVCRLHFCQFYGDAFTLLVPTCSGGSLHLALRKHSRVETCFFC